MTVASSILLGTRDLLLLLMEQSWEEDGNNSIGVAESSYVQWAKFPAGLVIEVSSDQFRHGDPPFTFEQRRSLQLLGFHPPVGPDAPNHWQMLDVRADLPEAALALARVVHEVLYGVGDEGGVSVVPFQQDPQGLLHRAGGHWMSAGTPDSRPDADAPAPEALYCILRQFVELGGGPAFGVAADGAGARYVTGSGGRSPWEGVDDERIALSAGMIDVRPTTPLEWLNAATSNLGFVFTEGPFPAADLASAVEELLTLLPDASPVNESFFAPRRAPAAAFATRAELLAFQRAAADAWASRYPAAACGDEDDPQADLELVHMMTPPFDPDAPHGWLPKVVDGTGCRYCSYPADHDLHDVPPRTRGNPAPATTRPPKNRQERGPVPELSDIDVPCVLFRVSRLYREGMDADAVYDITHGWWRMGDKREQAEYALAVADGTVRGVFRIHGWQARAQGDRDWQHDEPGKPRWGFEGEPAEDLQHLIGMDVRALFPQGAANPVRYLNLDPVSTQPEEDTGGQETPPLEGYIDPPPRVAGVTPNRVPSFREATLPFARSFLAKASLGREWSLSTRQTSRLNESLSIDLRKFCDIVVPALRRPEVSIAALRTADEIGIDLCQMTWHEQAAFDHGRVVFHCEHVMPIRSLREKCKALDTAEEIVDALDADLRVAWILKGEDRDLTAAGYAFNRPDPDDAYREVGIELTRCHPA